MTQDDSERSRFVHSTRSALLIVAAALVFALLLLTNVAAQLKWLFFRKDIAEVSRKFALPYQPVSSTFAIWGVIFSGLAALHLYSLANLCRRGKIGYLYKHAGLVNRSTLALLIASYLLTCAWLVLWSFAKVSLLPVCAALLIAIALLNYCALHTAQRGNFAAWHDASARLIDSLPNGENVAFQILVVNPIALFFGWTLMASVLNIFIALRHGTNFWENKEELELFTFFATLGSFALAYVFFDLVGGRRSAFTLGAYCAILAALVGIYFRFSDANSQYTLVHEGRTTALLLIVLFVTIAALKVFYCACNAAKCHKSLAGY